jgi:hypothetical protein
MFNAIKYTQELENAGFTHNQAEVSMKILLDVMNENFATKIDIKELDAKIGSETQKLESMISRLESRVTTEIQRVENKIEKIDSKIEMMEYKLIFKLGSLIVISTGVMATILKFSR